MAPTKFKVDEEYAGQIVQVEPEDDDHEPTFTFRCDHSDPTLGDCVFVSRDWVTAEAAQERAKEHWDEHDDPEFTTPELIDSNATALHEDELDARAEALEQVKLQNDADAREKEAKRVEEDRANQRAEAKKRTANRRRRAERRATPRAQTDETDTETDEEGD